MSYEYKATKAEERAAALLREKGWAVMEPPCPDCHGMGYVAVWAQWGSNEATLGSVGTKPCPRGCVLAAFFSTTTWPIESANPEIG